MFFPLVPELSLFGHDMATDEANEVEVSSSPSSDSEPSTTSSEIRHRLGPFSDPRFILANNSWLRRVGPDLKHFSSAMPMLEYRFVLPGREDIILSAPSDHFVVYRLALNAGL